MFLHLTPKIHLASWGFPSLGLVPVTVLSDEGYEEVRYKEGYIRKCTGCTRQIGKPNTGANRGWRKLPNKEARQLC